nr:phospholipase-like protein [Tanacetum cinerariifolium]
MDKEAAAPTVTIKAKIDVFKEIREALTPTQVEVFKKTCFGHWLNVGLKKNSQLLIHTVLACMVEGKANELSFLVLGKIGLEMVYINARCVMMPSARKGKKIQYTMTGFVWAFMIWILEAIPATRRYVHKQPTEKIPRALAWESTQPFTWSRCCTLFVGDQLAPPLETLTPTKAESETDWWKASLEYFEGKHVQ